MLARDFDAAVTHFSQHLESGHSRWMIALAGLPGSGKSTVAARLIEAVNSRVPGAMVALSMDGFHLRQEQLWQMPDPKAAFARRGAPWTFDVAALAQRLQEVRLGAGRQPIAWPDFQHEIGDPVEAVHFVAPETRLVLVEGNYLLQQRDGWAPIGSLFDERVYLDVPLDVAMERLTTRHMTAWNWTRSQAQNRIAANDKLNAQLVLQDREHGDWRLVMELKSARRDYKWLIK